METLQPIKWPHLRTVLLRVDERVQRSIRRCFPVSLRCTVIPVNLPAASLQVVPSFHLFMCGSRCRHSYLGRITNHPSNRGCTPHGSFSSRAPHPLPTPPPFLLVLHTHLYLPTVRQPLEYSSLHHARTALWQPMFVTGKESECEWVCVSEAVCTLRPTITSRSPEDRMDKPNVWRAVVSSTDPRRTRDPGSHPSRPGSAMGYRLYDMWVKPDCCEDGRTGRLAGGQARLPGRRWYGSHSQAEQSSGWQRKTLFLPTPQSMLSHLRLSDLAVSLLFPSHALCKQRLCSGEGWYGAVCFCLDDSLQ